MAKRILVADESHNVLRSIKVILGQDGYEVLGVSDMEALEATVRTARPHLVLIDVELPPTDGYLACRAIKDDPVNRSVAVLLMVGTFVAIDRTALDASRAEGFITKPVDPLALKARIREVLRDIEDTHKINLGQVPKVEVERAPAEDVLSEAEDLAGVAEIQADDLGDLADQDSTFPAEEDGEATQPTTAIQAPEEAAPTREQASMAAPSAEAEPPETPKAAPRLVAFVQKLKERTLPAEDESLTDEERRIIEDNEAMLRGVAPAEEGASASGSSSEAPAASPLHGVDDSADLASLVADEAEPAAVSAPVGEAALATAAGPAAAEEADAASAPSESVFDLDEPPPVAAPAPPVEAVQALDETPVAVPLPEEAELEPLPTFESKPAKPALDAVAPGPAESKAENVEEDRGSAIAQEVAADAPAPAHAAPASSATSMPTIPIHGRLPTTSEGTIDPVLIDRIVAAVVRRMSDDVVREIAWEIVPELAEIHIQKKVREQGS